MRFTALTGLAALVGANQPYTASFKKILSVCTTPANQLTNLVGNVGKSVEENRSCHDFAYDSLRADRPVPDKSPGVESHASCNVFLADIFPSQLDSRLHGFRGGAFAQ
jgi:hypothetical protein